MIIWLSDKMPPRKSEGLLRIQAGITSLLVICPFFNEVGENNTEKNRLRQKGNDGGRNPDKKVRFRPPSSAEMPDLR